MHTFWSVMSSFRYNLHVQCIDVKPCSLTHSLFTLDALHLTVQAVHYFATRAITWTITANDRIRQPYTTDSLFIRIVTDCLSHVVFNILSIMWLASIRPIFFSFRSILPTVIDAGLLSWIIILDRTYHAQRFIFSSFSVNFLFLFRVVD